MNDSLHIGEKHEDSTSGNNGCAGWFPAYGQAPTAYPGGDTRPGTVWQGIDIGTDQLDKVSPGETGVWIPQNVTDDYVVNRLLDMGMTDEAARYQETVNAA